MQELIKASAGPNLGMDFLPGALGYDPVAHPVEAGLAARTLAFDAYVENVDRSWRNPNLLIWHGGLWLIDHGATLYFHHDWSRAASVVHRAYRADDHVLRPFASAPTGPDGDPADAGRELADAGRELAARLTPDLLDEVIALVPDEWLDEPDRDRAAYRAHLSDRAARPEAWLP